MMFEDDLAAGGGATFFLTSACSITPTSPTRTSSRCPSPASAVRRCRCAVTQRAEDLGIQVYRSYGSTEHPSITGCYLEDPADKRMATDGHVMPGVEIRLDPETGEISSRGPDLCIGYTDPALTAQMFDADGWYRTGDVGVLDDDGLPHDHRPRERHHHPRRREHQRAGDRRVAAALAVGRRGGGGRRARRTPRRARRRGGAAA